MRGMRTGRVSAGVAAGAAMLAWTAGSAMGQCASVPVGLESATATYTQGCYLFAPSWAIDGKPGTGWALGRCYVKPEPTLTESLVFHTSRDVGGVNATQVTVRLFSGGAWAGEGGGNLTIGRFRLWVTSEDRGTFADGKRLAGLMGDGWRLLDVEDVKAVRATQAGAENPAPGENPSVSVMEDGSVLMVGPNPEFSVCTVTSTLAAGEVVTGLKVEFIDGNGLSFLSADGLPTGGPGRHTNGNMMLREVTLGESRRASMTQQPEGGTMCPRGSFTLAVQMDGSGPFTYQWRRNNAAIAGSNSPTLTVSGADAAGAYRCIVLSPCGNKVSDEVVVQVCMSDFNCDGFLDFFDYQEFVDAFDRGDELADVNMDEFVDFFDFLDFSAAFDAGC